MRGGYGPGEMKGKEDIPFLPEHCEGQLVDPGVVIKVANVLPRVFSVLRELDSRLVRLEDQTADRWNRSQVKELDALREAIRGIDL